MVDVIKRDAPMANLALGRYVPYDSIIHRLDPRLKLASLIVLMVASS
jgi:energy-coupling factor transport system permease protein